MERDLYWDSLKCVLIFFVVYGHIIEVDYPIGSFNRAMYNFIYTFHMPLFIFISGRFSHIRDRQKYKKNILRLFETYVIFQVLLTIVSIAHGGEFNIDFLTMPNWILWYLLALIYWRITIYLVPKRWLQHQKYMIIASLAICLLGGFIPVGPHFVVQRTLSSLPFFVLGYYSINYNITKYIDKIPVIATIIVLVLTFAFLYFMLNRNLNFVVNGSLPYRLDNYIHTLMHIGARCLFIPIAIIIGSMIMRLTPTNATLARWGSVTMFIYIYHSIAVLFLYIAINRYIIPNNEFLLFIYGIIVTLCMIYLSRIRYFNVLLNPISYFYNNHKKH